MLNPGDEVSFSADHEVAGVRLDQVLSQRFRAYSRSYLSRAIERGAVRVDAQPRLRPHTRRLRRADRRGLRLLRSTAVEPEVPLPPLHHLVQGLRRRRRRGGRQRWHAAGEAAANGAHLRVGEPGELLVGEEVGLVPRGGAVA